MSELHPICRAELARLRAEQAAQTHADAQTQAAPIAPAGVSERNRAEILNKIDAIETQMRSLWAAPDLANPLKP